MSKWCRVCSRCNGLVYAGEGQHIPSRNYGPKHFIVHKTVELCKHRQRLRGTALQELKTMPEQTVTEWYEGMKLG